MKRLASFILATLVSTQAWALDKVVFQTEYIPSGEHAAYYGGWEKGVFAKHGIDIEIRRGYGSGDTVLKTAAKNFDFGSADMGAILTAAARQKLPITVIAPIYNYSPHALFVLEGSGIESLKDIGGKRIGITPGNSHRVYFPRVARAVGVDPDSVTWVNMDGGAMATQLINGNIDIAPFFAMHEFYQNRFAQSAGKKIRVLPYSDSGFKIYSLALITNPDLAKSNPDLVRRFVEAAKEAWTWANDNPDEACAMHIRKVPEVSLEDCVGTLKLTLPYVFNEDTTKLGLGKVDPARMQATWAAVADAEGLDENWDPMSIVDASAK